VKSEIEIQRIEDVYAAKNSLPGFVCSKRMMVLEKPREKNEEEKWRQIQPRMRNYDEKKMRKLYDVGRQSFFSGGSVS
jgi:hypothetical protein